MAKAKTKPADKGAKGATGTKSAKAGMDHKQQSANYMRSVAVRSGGDSISGPEADREAELGNERSSALSPSDRARANTEARRTEKAGAGKSQTHPAEEPMGDQVPVSGLDDTPHGRDRADGDPAKEARMDTKTKSASEPKALTRAEGENEGQFAGRQRQAAETHLADKAKSMTLEELADELPVGSEIRVTQEGITILAAIAGGAKRAFGGRTLHEAMAAMKAEAIYGPQIMGGDDGRPSPDPKQTAAAEAEDRSTRGKVAKRPVAKAAGAKKTARR